MAGHLRPFAMSNASRTTSMFNRPAAMMKVLPYSVRDRDDLSGADPEGSCDEIRKPDADVRDRHQQHQRLRHLKREQATFEPEPEREHQRDRNQEDESLLTPTQPEVSCSRYEPGDCANQIGR